MVIHLHAPPPVAAWWEASFNDYVPAGTALRKFGVAGQFRDNGRRPFFRLPGFWGAALIQVDPCESRFLCENKTEAGETPVSVTHALEGAPRLRVSRTC